MFGWNGGWKCKGVKSERRARRYYVVSCSFRSSNGSRSRECNHSLNAILSGISVVDAVSEVDVGEILVAFSVSSEPAQSYGRRMPLRVGDVKVRRARLSGQADKSPLRV